MNKNRQKISFSSKAGEKPENIKKIVSKLEPKDLTHLGSFSLRRDFEGEPIYMVTSVPGPKTDHDPRCWGFFYKLEDAINSAENNEGDMYEAGYYPYVVVEKVEQGICNMAEQVQWFKYKADPKSYMNGKYIKCKRPKFSERIVNYW